MKEPAEPLPTLPPEDLEDIKRRLIQEYSLIIESPELQLDYLLHLPSVHIRFYNSKEGGDLASIYIGQMASKASDRCKAIRHGMGVMRYSNGR